MSTPTINQIQNIARGGYASIDMKSGDIVAGKKGFAGHAASWFTAKLHPGETAARNGAVMNAFIHAISSDPAYGPDYANMASHTLAAQWGKGKPLTERAISTTLTILDEVKSTENEAAVATIAEGYEQLCSTLASNTPSAATKGFATFFNSTDRAINTEQSGMTEPEQAAVLNAALSTFISSVPESDLPQIQQALANLSQGQPRNVLNHINQMANERGASPQMRTAAKRVQETADLLQQALATRLGNSKQSAPPETGMVRPSRKAVEDNATALLQSMGVNFPPATLVGRSGAGQYSARFMNHLAQDINKEFAKQRRWNGDYAADMAREMGRNTMVVEGKRVSTPGADSKKVQAKLDDFFGDDVAGKRAVSSVAHQGLFAGIFDQFTSGNGLFTGLATPSGDEHPSYEIHRNPDGGYHVLASSSSAVQNLQTTDGDTLLLNPEFSRFSTTIEFDISRESIDAGKPEITISGKQRFGYAFMPDTFTI